jgi:hypothetical protein
MLLTIQVHIHKSALVVILTIRWLTENSIHDIVFVAQLLDSLMVSSNFITQIGCGQSAMQS